MSHKDVFWQTQAKAYFTHFIFEKFPQWFQQFQLHAFGQSSHIVVALYERGGIPSYWNAFYNVGIEGALSQKIDFTNTSNCFVENLNEGFADDFSFSFRISYAFEFLKKKVGLTFND